MFTALLIGGILLASGAIAYALVIASKLRKENLFLRNKCNDLLVDLNLVSEKLTEALKSQFSEIDEVLKNERDRIAHELHDDIVQRLVAIRFRLEQLSYHILKPEIEDEINQLRNELGGIMRDLRYVIGNLVQPQIENADLNTLTADFVSKHKVITRIKFDLSIEEPERAFHLDVPVKKELFLLIQEAVQNSTKHSAGNTIKITLSWRDDLTIEIFSDGVGFLQSRPASVGMVSMKERCVKIGATFKNFNKMGRFHAVVLITLPRPGFQTIPLR